MSFGDPMASVVGLTFKSPINFNNKSVVGVIGCCVTCILVAIIFYNSEEMIIYSILAGTIGGIAECIDIKGLDDNLTMPVISGVLLTIVNKVLIEM